MSARRSAILIEVFVVLKQLDAILSNRFLLSEYIIKAHASA